MIVTTCQATYNVNVTYILFIYCIIPKFRKFIRGYTFMDLYYLSEFTYIGIKKRQNKLLFIG